MIPFLMKLKKNLMLRALNRSPFRRASAPKYEASVTDSDISFVSSGRPVIDRMFRSFHDPVDDGMDSGFLNSNYSEHDNMSPRGLLSINKADMNSSLYDVSFSHQGSVNSLSWSSQSSSVVKTLNHFSF